MIAPIITPVTSADLDAALQLLFQQTPIAERESSIANAHKLFHAGELASQGLLVARHQGQVVGAILAVLAAGAVGLVWPPQVNTETNRHQIEDALLTAIFAWFRLHQVKVSQVLLPPQEAHLGESLLRNGFRRLTRLLFLRAPATDVPPTVLTSNALTLERYSPETRERFEATLLETYEGTQDCPELDNVRSIDEVIAGHQAQGSYDPARWWLASHADVAVGVLLMNKVPEWKAFEIVYMGIIPRARRRGFARQLVRMSMREAHDLGAEQVTLSVDERNVAAQKLYGQLGFQIWDQRDAYLAILDKDEL